MGQRTSHLNYMEYYAATSEAFALDARAWGPAWNRGATAPAWDRPAWDQPEVRPRQPEPDARPQSNPRSRRRAKVVYTRAVSNERFFSGHMLFTLLMIFLGLVAITVSSAAIKQSQLGLSAMRAELLQLQEDEAVLRTKIAEEFDVTQIEKIATMRLNMSKPKAYQIVYINTPKQDYVVQYGSVPKVEPEDFFTRVAGLVAAFGF